MAVEVAENTDFFIRGRECEAEDVGLCVEDVVGVATDSESVAVGKDVICEESGWMEGRDVKTG